MTSEDLLALTEHVQVHLREEWNVREHDRPQKVEVAECEVEFVRHLDAPLLRLLDVHLRPVEAQKLSSHSDRIKCDESCVSGSDKIIFLRILQMNNHV